MALPARLKRLLKSSPATAELADYLDEGAAAAEPTDDTPTDDTPAADPEEPTGT